MDKVDLATVKTVLADYVKLSEPYTCKDCGETTKLIGETRANGNWICPNCFAYYPYKTNPDIKVSVPFTILTDQLEEKDKPKASGLLALPSATFPMNLTTGFLVPSYSNNYRIKRKRNVLLAQAIDFTRFGRIKSGEVWSFELGFGDRQRVEYETLIDFVNSQGYHLPFNYTDPFRGTAHVCYFDSDVSDAQPASFDGVSFSVSITE
jgi:hypothetical protein